MEPLHAHPTPFLRYGSKGEAVKDLQRHLNDYLTRGFSSAQPPAIKVDGTFGTSTRARVKHFQREQGMSAVGVVGTRTWKKLHSPTTW